MPRSLTQSPFARRCHGALLLVAAVSAAHAQPVPVPPPVPVRDNLAVPAIRWSRDTAYLGDGRIVPPLPRLLGVREQFNERMRWTAQRHERLLPMMRAHGVSMWIVMNEEFHNDPLTEHVAPPLVYVSRRDAHVFVDGGERGLLRYSNYWRPTASYAGMFEPLPAPRSDRGTSNLTLGLRELVARTQPATIALAIGGPRGQDGGLSKDSYELIVDAIGPEYATRIIPAAPLIEEYLDTRLPGELEHYRQLVHATDRLAQRALSNEVITPGVTTAADVAWWFNDQIARLGVGATPWFEVHTAVQRFDAKANAMIPYVHPAPDPYVFQAGDVVHLDCGFNYMGLASDWQKVAYILPPGEIAVPAGLEVALHNAMRTREALRMVARPGMTGYAAAEATVSALTGVSFTPSIYSHPIGTHGHGVGPSINARGAILPAPPERDSPLRLGSYRSIELSATTRIPEWNDGQLIIPFEDDAVLTPQGYEWFVPPQNRWYLIRSGLPPAPTTRRRAPAPLALFEDYRRTAGVRRGDTLTASFSIRAVRWRPEGRANTELPAYAFVEDGQPARVPGPLLRAPAGSVVRVRLHNTLGQRLVVFGLNDHAPARGLDSVSLDADARATVTFRVNAAGTYYYFARLRPAVQHPTAPVPDDFPSGEKGEGPLVGALIVDAAGTPAPRGERVLLIHRWLDDDDPRTHNDPNFKMMMNGASWPVTERLHYTVGDTVRWRVINASATQHPMHLHGFYFTVTGHGDGLLDTLLAPAQHRQRVTQVLGGNETMSLTWVPERPGNWLFHCHLVRHMSLRQRIDAAAAHAASAHMSTSVHHAEENMAGLVMGIHVAPRAGRTAARAVALATGRTPGAPAVATLRVVATERRNVFGTTAGRSFVQQRGSASPANDSLPFPASTLVLRRGEPSAITVVNRLASPLAVHWHGLEIESWYDGVGGWSGAGRRVRPPIAPGDSFVVRITPPRAGTFMYHSHDEAGAELGTGLYGALIVEEPGAPRDSTRDHVIVMGMLGAPGSESLAIDGRTGDTPLALAPGVHRLRFVSIPVDEEITVAFVRDTATQQWRELAVDGAEVPAVQQVPATAKRTVSAGQTFDVEVNIPPDASDAYALQFTTLWYPTDPRTAQPPPIVRVPIRVLRP